MTFVILLLVFSCDEFDNVCPWVGTIYLYEFLDYLTIFNTEDTVYVYLAAHWPQEIVVDVPYSIVKPPECNDTLFLLLVESWHCVLQRVCGCAW